MRSHTLHILFRREIWNQLKKSSKRTLGKQKRVDINLSFFLLKKYCGWDASHPNKNDRNIIV